MPRVVIFGNSGSGKTTLARRLAGQYALAHLDLDDVAWRSSDPPARRSLEESCHAIDDFLAANQNVGWVVEGCYADLIAHAGRHADRMIFLNPGIDACLANCRQRPWEPEKYGSREEQDANLEMLLSWVRDYESREDECSLCAHCKLFSEFRGERTEVASNLEAGRLVL